MPEGPPRWDWQEVLHVKPGDSTEWGIQRGDRFVRSVREKIEAYREFLEQGGFSPEAGDTLEQRRAQWESWVERILARAGGKDLMRQGREYHGDGP